MENSSDPASLSTLLPKLIETEEARDTAFASVRRGSLDAAPSQFPSLDAASSPFSITKGDGYIDTRESIRLCVKAYWAFPLLRNVVEVMCELSNSKLYLKGGNKKTREFIESWLEKIKIELLKEQFFREWFRSANVFLYRFDADFTPQQLAKLNQAYGSLKNALSVPIKYLILNPETITAGAGATFDKWTYVKLLNGYEVAKLRNPQTPEEQAVLDSLDSDAKKAIQAGASQIPLKLDAGRLNVLLYKAQPYEPMGVPMAHGVLKDIEAKLELKRIDMSIARTTDRALLLLTVGETPNQFNRGSNINPNTLAALQNAFANESVARTLIADYTVNGKWLVPEIDKILGKQKYEQLDKDINTGLNAVLFGEGEKFANTSIKVQIFIERLKEARTAFLSSFLQPEIDRVCRAINAKSIPQVSFADLSLKDELQYAKIFVQLAQLGLLTPQELFEAMDSGKIPINEESLVNQREFKNLREEGLYLPLIGGAAEIQKQQLAIQQQQMEAQTAASKAIQPSVSPPSKPVGRPEGSKAPKTNVTPSPIGTSKANLSGFSLKTLGELLPQVSELQNSIEAALKKRYKLRKLSDAQLSIGKQLVEAIISNETRAAWMNSVSDYLETPKEMDATAAAEIDELRLKHDVDSYTAAILRLSKTN